MLDESKVRENLDSLRKEILSLKYLVRMDEGNPVQSDSELVAQLAYLEQELECLLNMIRRDREEERGVLGSGSARPLGMASSGKQ